MPDYGHSLQFGTFITPSAHDPDGVVALAQLSESVGLDLVTFQDHPYNADQLETWTLLSWVAASTERITVAGNVLNLPLRHPALLAKQGATLDVLSHGRFAMGIGTGAFWDAMAGMGARRQTPGESIASLSEAIDILRSMWSETGPRRVRHSGERYTISGMARGPVPAHDIPIWIGACKPKMLRLTGQKGDGWLPSLGYLAPEDIAAANAAIDTAATAAGRSPREIRRMLNLLQGSFSATNAGFLKGPPAQWVEEIAGLAIEHGFGTFIYPGDNPRAIQLFAEDVVPGVREMVDRERRETGTDTSTPRSQRALSLRSAQIAYEALPQDLRSKSIEPGDFGYERSRHTYMRAGSPGLVIYAENVADVQSALAFARTQPVSLGIRSGGHGISGRSTNEDGIILDLSRMNSIVMLNEPEGIIRVEPGAVWGDVAAFLAPYGRALTSGDYGDVGVGGLATTGGVGYLGRKYGLTIDHLVAAEIVLADGTFLRVDNDHHADLFWAIRGAGGNFGVVTAFEFTTDPVGEVVFGVLIADATKTAPLLERWARLVEASPREVTSFVTLVPESRDQPTTAQFIIVYAGDDIGAASTAITPFYEQLGPVLQQQAQLVPYAAVVAPYDSAHTGKGLDASRSGLVQHVSPQVAQGMEAMLDNREAQFVQIRAVGGAVNDLPADATAYAHRHQNFSLLAASTASREAALDRGWSRIKPFVDGMYLSFETGTGSEVVESAFPPATLARLRDLKQRYDPENVFNQNFGIEQEAVIAL